MKKIIIVANTKRNRNEAKKCANPNSKRSTIIIVMAMPLAIHKIIAVLAMPSGITERGDRAKVVTDACAASTYVSVLPATITAVRLTITNYNAATTSSRTAKYRLMVNALNSMMRMFQDAADADAENSQAIVESGAFKVHQVAIPQKHKFDVVNGAVLGTVDLTAQGGGTYTCHDWMYSPDGITFTRMTPTVAAHTHKDGLEVGKFAYFTHELITKDGPQGISQIMKVMVGAV